VPQPWHRPNLAKALNISVDELAQLLTNGVFDGGVLDEQHQAEITLDDGELASFRFCEPEEAGPWVRRLLGGVTVCGAGRP
jgi:hypothetical protein